MPTLDEVIEVIAAQTGLESGALSGSASLSDLGLTSYAMMRLLIRLEDHFACELTPDDLAHVFTMPVPQILAAIERSDPVLP